MCMPLSPSDTLFQQFLQDLPSDFKESANQYKAFQRARKLRHPQDLLRIIFLHCGLGFSLRETAASFTLIHEQLTDTAVTNRLWRCKGWLHHLIRQMCDSGQEPNHSKYRFLLGDASSVRPPGKTRTERVYKVHLLYNLFTSEFAQVHLADYNTGEKISNFKLKENDVFVGDRGYCSPSTIEYSRSQKAHLIIRSHFINAGLHTLDGQEFDYIKELKRIEKAGEGSFEVISKSSARGISERCILHARKIPEHKADEQRRKAISKAKRRGKTLSKLSLYLKGWVLVMTTIPQEELSREQILAIYRRRWQIELVFKRLKTLLHLDELKAKVKKRLSGVWMAGKLLYAMCIDKKARERLYSKDCMTECYQTCWSLWKLYAISVVPMITGSLYWKEEHWAKALHVLKQRRRQRKLQMSKEKLVQVFAEKVHFIRYIHDF